MSAWLKKKKNVQVDRENQGQEVQQQFEHDFIEFVTSTSWMEEFEKSANSGKFYVLLPFPESLKNVVFKKLTSDEMTTIARKTRLFGRFLINVTGYGVAILLN